MSERQLNLKILSNPDLLSGLTASVQMSATVLALSWNIWLKSIADIFTWKWVILHYLNFASGSTNTLRPKLKLESPPCGYSKLCPRWRRKLTRASFPCL